MRKYDVVFFDMDGTIVDTLDNITFAVNGILRRFGMPEHEPAQIRPFLGYGTRYLLSKAVPQGTPPDVLEEVIAQYLPYYAAYANKNVAPYEGIISLLEELKARGFLVAIISNKPEEAMQPIVEKYFSHLTDLAVGARSGIRKKPEPDMLINAAQQLGVDLCRCLYVGDSEADLLAAKNAGIACVSVCWGFRSRDELIRAGAEVLIDKPSELLGYCGW